MVFSQFPKCQNCDAPVLQSDEHCQSCGAKLLHRRVVIGVPKADEFALQAEEPSNEVDEPANTDGWDFPARGQERPLPREFDTWTKGVRWGGFLPRAGAFLIDLLVIALLSALMGAMAYVGYKVGLAAHNRPISWNNVGPLVSFMTMASIGLATVYFVVFHGMDGKTVGKWLFGLRVTGPGRAPITYRKALFRWIATVGLGPASLGLAFLWILWQREKRGWHDLLARTWVIRE